MTGVWTCLLQCQRGFPLDGILETKIHQCIEKPVIFLEDFRKESGQNKVLPLTYESCAHLKSRPLIILLWLMSSSIRKQLMKCQMFWAGHVVKTKYNRLSVALFSGELTTGKVAQPLHMNHCKLKHLIWNVLRYYPLIYNIYKGVFLSTFWFC